LANEVTGLQMASPQLPFTTAAAGSCEGYRAKTHAGWQSARLGVFPALYYSPVSLKPRSMHLLSLCLRTMPGFVQMAAGHVTLPVHSLVVQVGGRLSAPLICWIPRQPDLLGFTVVIKRA